MAEMLIKNMEMPKTCAKCIGMSIPVRCRVKETEFVTAVMSGCDRPDDCPLVELSLHGRLKDIDAILDRLNRLAVIDELMYTSAIEGIKKMLDEFPTVIPASEV